MKRPPKNGEQQTTIINTLLVDGNALFKTGLFGAKNVYNNQGQHIGGLYQFLTVVRKLLNENLYHRVFVFWDGDYSGLLRYKIYEPYKSDRGKDFVNGTKPKEESEVNQRLMVMQYLEELFIRQLMHPTIESDDFIAYFCLTRKENEKVTICTNDRDMAQLINEDVRVYFCDLKAYVDLDNYNLFFKHHKDNSMLIKMIAGDDSDSIKGVKGVKEPTLLTIFPELTERKVELEEIIERAKDLQQKRLDSKLKPLKNLHNIINSITDGPQGEKLYEINKKLVDLSTPLLTEDGIDMLNELVEQPLNPDGRSVKNAYVYMKRDGIDLLLGEARLTEYFVPFKKLIARETRESLLD